MLLRHVLCSLQYVDLLTQAIKSKVRMYNTVSVCGSHTHTQMTQCLASNSEPPNPLGEAVREEKSVDLQPLMFEGICVETDEIIRVSVCDHKP